MASKICRFICLYLNGIGVLATSFGPFFRCTIALKSLRLRRLPPNLCPSATVVRVHDGALAQECYQNVGRGGSRLCLSHGVRLTSELSPVHTINNVEATLSTAKSRTILWTKSNAVSTLLPFFLQQSRMLLQHCCFAGVDGALGGRSVR